MFKMIDKTNKIKVPNLTKLREFNNIENRSSCIAKNGFGSTTRGANWPLSAAGPKGPGSYFEEPNLCLLTFLDVFFSFKTFFYMFPIPNEEKSTSLTEPTQVYV